MIRSAGSFFRRAASSIASAATLRAPEAVMKSFELDKPAKDQETSISRTGHHLPRRDDRDNIERGFGRDLLVHALAVFDSIQVPLQRLGGERVFGPPLLPAPDLQRPPESVEIGTGAQGGSAKPGIAQGCGTLGGVLRVLVEQRLNLGQQLGVIDFGTLSADSLLPLDRLDETPRRTALVDA